MRIKTIVTVYMLLIFSFVFITSQRTEADNRTAILVVGDHSNSEMFQREEVLKKYLVHYRQKSGNDASTIPIFVYDFSQPAVREYCEKVLGITRSDLLFLGIVSARGKLPTKVHLKVVNPQNLENNAKLVMEKFTSTAATGTLFITSDPSGAKVWLEKTYKGRTPLTIKGLAEGDYTVTLVHPARAKTRQTVFVKENKVTNTQIAMPAVEGVLAVRSNPSEAEVYVNDVFYGKTPVEIKDLEPGKYDIVLKLDDMKWEGIALVESGKTSTITGNLTAVVAVRPTPSPAPTPAPTPAKTPEETPAPVIETTPQTPLYPAITTEPGSGVTDAFVPKSQTNQIFQVTVTNTEEVSSIKDYYKPKPGYKFVVVYLQQQNISSEVQIYTGKFSLVDQRNASYEDLDKLSNFWMVVLRPGGMNMGYLVYEIPEDSKPMGVVLHGLNMPPLSVTLK